MKEKAKKYLKYVGRALMVLSIIFLGRAIYKLGFDFSTIHNVPLFIGVCFAGVIIKSVTVVLSGLSWTRWLTFLKKDKVSKKEALIVYGKANIGKYLPGNVMHYVERNLFATNLGIDQKRLAFSSAIEVIELIAVAFLMAVMFASGNFRTVLANLSQNRMPVLIALGAGVILVIIAAVVIAIKKRSKLKQFLEGYTLKDFISASLYTMISYAAVLILLGIIMVFLYAYIIQQMPDPLTSCSIVSAYDVAWVTGFVVPGASGGIGVREAALTLLLKDTVGPGNIMLLSVVHRLITIIGDFLVYLIVLIAGRKKKE